MITIIHGDDVVSSRNFLVEAKKKQKNSITLYGESLTITDIVENTQSSSLFGSSETLFIEEFFFKKKGKEYEEILSFLESAKNIDIVVWEAKQLSKKTVNSLKKTTIKEFSIPQTLFSFLDSLIPNNSKTSIALFHKTLQSSETELVFFMLIRQFRLLLAVLEESKDQIDEVKRLAPWQSQKLTKQAKFFGREKLLHLYKKLYILDKGVKSGELQQPLNRLIDFFLAEI